MRGVSRTTMLLMGGLLALFSFAPALAYHEDPQEHHEIANDYFQRTWERTDKPVADQEVDRTWIWGPEPYTEGIIEPYAESPGNRREVQYFDKSRMEITDPDGDSDTIWFVTNGLLVNELISGTRQVGDDSFLPFEPAEVNVAGDPDDPDAVTYADLADVLDAPAAAVGTPITQRIAAGGAVTNDPALAERDVTAAERVTVPGIDHTVASPFWGVMNADGLVYTDGAFTTDRLFENPFYATGYPVTEAYWTNVDVGGTDHLVLLQCFERRCLTYTPENPAGWQVEFGNVGQHYYRWRYASGNSELVNIYLVQSEQPAESTSLAFGCGDELVPVQQEVPVSNTLEGDITNALNALLALDEQFYGESGLLNALWLNDATIDSVTVKGNLATVHLSGTIPSGGICDDPRIVEQLRATVLQFDGLIGAAIFLNGELLVPSLIGGQEFTVDLASLNGSGVNGTFELTLDESELTVEGNLSGLMTDQEHPMHIHGLADDIATCPTAANDTNTDGTIDITEGAPAYGDVLVDLAPYPVADGDTEATFSETYDVDPAVVGPLRDRVIVVHGMVVDVDGEPQYDASVPVACGLIRSTSEGSYFASLHGENVVPSVETDATGWFVGRISADRTAFSWQLVGTAVNQATDAHVHLGDAGENGEIIYPLWFTESLPFSGSGQIWSGKVYEDELPEGVTIDLLLSLFNDFGVYIDVHTTGHPDGEIRGQLNQG